jgi:hypothetical protein
MPGSGLARDYTGMQRLAWRFLLPVMRVLPHVHSARTSGRNLAAPAGDERFADVTGKYFLGPEPVSSSAESYDLGKAADLWETSERLIAAVGVTGESRRG